MSRRKLHFLRSQTLLSGDAKRKPIGARLFNFPATTEARGNGTTRMVADRAQLRNAGRVCTKPMKPAKRALVAQWQDGKVA